MLSTMLIAAVLFQKAFSKCGDTFLSDLQPGEYEVDDLQHYIINEINGETTVLLGDKNTYEKFLVTFPPDFAEFGSVEYFNLNGNYNQFTAVIGLAESNGCNSEVSDGVIVKFYIDNTLIFTSATLNSLSDYQNIDLDIKNGNKLKIEIYKRNTNDCDYAIIANPLLRYKSLPLPSPHDDEAGSCVAARWFEIGDLSDIIDISDGKTEYNFYNYVFGVYFNQAIHEIIYNTWNKGIRVSAIKEYPCGDNADYLQFCKTLFTYDLDGNPTPDNWYQEYYVVDTDQPIHGGVNTDCVKLYARKINEWQEIGVLGDIKSNNWKELISGYSVMDYEYGVYYNNFIHKAFINGWNQGIRISTSNSYPMGDNAKELKFGRTVFTKGLGGRDNLYDWFQTSMFLNGNEKYSTNEENDVRVFVKERESMCF